VILKPTHLILLIYLPKMVFLKISHHKLKITNQSQETSKAKVVV
jgi:hypothetical protein